MSPHLLNGLSVLVTRPQRQQQSLSSSIESYGGVAVSFPLIEIEPLKDTVTSESLKEKISNLNQYHCIIFVSSNAVEYGAKLIKEFWPEFPRNIDVIAIGPSTSRMVSTELACKVIHSRAGSSSEDLLSLPQLADVKQLKVAIVRGQGGRELLANTLRERGAGVDYLEVYHRIPVRQSPAQLLRVIQKFNVNVYSITSGASLEKLNNLLLPSDESQPYLRDIPVIVPSDRVYLQAEQFGFKNVKLANGADVKSTIIALQELDIEADKIDSD